MPLMGDPKKVGSVAKIISRMKGGQSSDDMRTDNEEMIEAMTNEDGYEVDQSSAIEAAAEGLIRAVELKDVYAVKRSLKSFIEMTMSEMENGTEEDED